MKRPHASSGEWYSRLEHLYVEGPVHARPGDEKVYDWGRLVVERLPPHIENSQTHICAGCRYGLLLFDPSTSVCEHCRRRYHSDCLKPASNCGDSVFCQACLPPGAPENAAELLKFASPFERAGFRIIMIERIENRQLAAEFADERERMSQSCCSPTEVTVQRLFHLSAAGFGNICANGFNLELAKKGNLGQGIYFSDNPIKCDHYWFKATQGKSAEAGLVVAAHTGKDPKTTRVMYACQVLTGATKELLPSEKDRQLTAPPPGFDSVAGCFNGQREVAVYKRQQVLLEYMIHYEVNSEYADHQLQSADMKQYRQFSRVQHPMFQSAPELFVGSRVILHGLPTKDMNGKRGILRHWNPKKSCWCVQVLGVGGLIDVDLANLRPSLNGDFSWHRQLHTPAYNFANAHDALARHARQFLVNMPSNKFQQVARMELGQLYQILLRCWQFAAWNLKKQGQTAEAEDLRKRASIFARNPTVFRAWIELNLPSLAPAGLADAGSALKLDLVQMQFGTQLNEMARPFDRDQQMLKAAKVTGWQFIEGEQRQQWRNSDCTICLERLLVDMESSELAKNIVVLPCCGDRHAFHAGCLGSCFKFGPMPTCYPCPSGLRLVGHLRCPTCMKLYGERSGDAPEGNIRITRSPSSLAGHEQSSTFAFHIRYPSGIQQEIHPDPGAPFKGKKVTCYFPDTEEGRAIVWRACAAFARRLLFTVGDSATSGRMSTVKFSSIHLKTRQEGGAEMHGYPDLDYLARIGDELNEHDVPAAPPPQELQEMSLCPQDQVHEFIWPPKSDRRLMLLLKPVDAAGLRMGESLLFQTTAMGKLSNVFKRACDRLAWPEEHVKWSVGGSSVSGDQTAAELQLSDGATICASLEGECSQRSENEPRAALQQRGLFTTGSRQTLIKQLEHKRKELDTLFREAQKAVGPASSQATFGVPPVAKKGRTCSGNFPASSQSSSEPQPDLHVPRDLSATSALVPMAKLFGYGGIRDAADARNPPLSVAAPTASSSSSTRPCSTDLAPATVVNDVPDLSEDEMLQMALELSMQRK